MYYYEISWQQIKTHTQGNGARANGVIILTGTTKSQFSASVYSSVIPDLNGTKFTEEVFCQNLKKIPLTIPEIQAIKLSKKIYSCSYYSSFCTLCINRYNSRMRASIWLKFGTRIGGLKANTIIKFGIILINIQGVTSNFTHKTVEFLSSLQNKLLQGTS